MLHIRPARKADAGAIAILLDDLGHPSSADHVRRQLDRIRSDADETVLVAEKASTVAGVLALQIVPQFHQEPPLARIVDLCVLESFRGKGVGRQLVARAEDIARRKHCHKLEVTSNNIRKDAHRFYLKYGLAATHHYFAKQLG